MKKSAEPKWNQTFLYSHIHRRDFRERMLEITVWDQPRVQEEESEFMGEVCVCVLQLFCLDSKISNVYVSRFGTTYNIFVWIHFRREFNEKCICEVMCSIPLTPQDPSGSFGLQIVILTWFKFLFLSFSLLRF